MSDVLLKTSALTGAPRAQLARLCRQICLSREQGKMSAATAEEEFSRARESVHLAHGSLEISDQELREIVSIEERRVADAAVLAELISSRIAAPHNSVTLPKNEPVATATLTIDRSSSPAAKSDKGSTPPLGIADFIDGMLAQEKRPAASSARH